MHSPVGDGSLVGEYRAFLVEPRERAVVLKGEGESTERAGQRMNLELKKKYPDWKIDALTSFVRAAYAE